MRQSTASAVLEAAQREQDLLHIQTSPLRTATGFVVGTALSGALWTVAGMLAWYLT